MNAFLSYFNIMFPKIADLSVILPIIYIGITFKGLRPENVLFLP